MKLIDLSQTIEDDLSVYPGDLPVKLAQLKKFSSDGYGNFQLCTGMHAGTHVDGPMHLTDSNTFIGSLPLEMFTGKGIVVDVKGHDLIELSDKIRSRIESCEIILFYSGRSKFFGEEEYFRNYPVVDEKLVHYLVDKNVKIIGIDWPSPDCDPYPMHQILLKNNILILENLKNLGLLLSEPVFEVFAFPLKINADSSLVRVVARIS